MNLCGDIRESIDLFKKGLKTLGIPDGVKFLPFESPEQILFGIIGILRHTAVYTAQKRNVKTNAFFPVFRHGHFIIVHFFKPIQCFVRSAEIKSKRSQSSLIRFIDKKRHTIGIFPIYIANRPVKSPADGIGILYLSLIPVGNTEPCNFKFQIPKIRIDIFTPRLYLFLRITVMNDRCHSCIFYKKFRLLFCLVKLLRLCIQHHKRSVGIL